MIHIPLTTIKCLTINNDFRINLRGKTEQTTVANILLEISCEPL